MSATTPATTEAIDLPTSADEFPVRAPNVSAGLTSRAASATDRAAVAISPARSQPARAAWTAYVERTPTATLFHHPLWCDSVQTVFGHQPVHLIALRPSPSGASATGSPSADAAGSSHVVGVLPLMEVRSWLAGRLLVSVPYGTYGGILCDDDEARDALVGEAVRLTHERGARALELRSASAMVPPFEHDDRYAGFRRELPRRLEELRTFLPRKARAAVRQAREREGLTVRFEGSDAAAAPIADAPDSDGPLALVWRLYARNMRRLASLTYPRRFFTELKARLGRRAWVTTVWRQGQPVAGLLSFVFGDTVMPYFVGVDERLRCMGSTNLLYMATMERAVRCGLHWFDFGRSRRDNPGPYAFKRNQGFEPRVLGYQRYAPPGRSAPDLTPGNPRFGLARRIWPSLPLVATSRLGAWLSKSVPG